MGFTNLTNVKFTPEFDEKIVRRLHSLVKFCILETFEPSYYAQAKDHAIKALNKHREIYEAYPELYDLLFTSPDLVDKFLDAHKIVGAMYLTASGVNEEIIFKILHDVQINRVFLYFLNMLSKNMEMLLNVSYLKSQVRKLFYKFLERVENEKGKNYSAFFTVKYRRKLQSLFAELRIKRKKLSDFWKEATDLLFINKSMRRAWSYEIFREISKLRGNMNIKEVKKIPFSNYLGYIWKRLRNRNMTPDEIKDYIYTRTDLMTDNEVKRVLAKLQESGKLDVEEVKEKVEKRVKRAPSDAFSLLSSLFVLKDDAKEITMDSLEDKVKDIISKITLRNKKIGVAVDVSGNTKGYEWNAAGRTFTMRRTVDKNLLLGYVLANVSKLKAISVFNEKHYVCPVDNISIRDFVEEILKAIPDGGSAPTLILKTLAEMDYDIIIMISDFNENIPMRGYMKIKLQEIAKKFKKPIFLIQTELDVSELSALEEVIFDNKLDNVYLMPIKKLEQLVQLIETLELDEEIKRIIIQILKKKKEKAAEIYV